jgi:signal peptidase I
MITKNERKLLRGLFIFILAIAALCFVLDCPFPLAYTSSDSMEPILEKGDLLLIQRQDSYEIGDIIVFEAEEVNIPISHRLIEINPDGTYQTKGDANEAQLNFERSIEPETIAGRVLQKFSFLGWILYIPDKLLGWLNPLVLVAIIIGAIYYIVKY